MKSMRASMLFVAVVLIFASLPVQAQDNNKIMFFAFDQYTTVSDGEVSVLPSGGSKVQGAVFAGPFYLFVPDRFGMTPLVGEERVEVSYSVDANSMGPYWGKWSVDFGEYGYVEGNYSGKVTPFVDHADGFTPKVMMIGQSGQLQGTFHGAGGDEKWLIKLISGVSKVTPGAATNSMDYFGEIFIK